MGFVINNVFVATFSLICTSRLYITLTEEDTFVQIKSAVRMVAGHWPAPCQYLQNKGTGDCARFCKHDGSLVLHKKNLSYLIGANVIAECK